MATNIITARGTGLSTAPGSSGDSGKDGLTRADNVVCYSPNVWETRRGIASFGSVVAGKVLDYLSEAFGQLVLHHEDGSTYLWDVDTAGTSPVYLGSYSNPADGGRFRTFEAARSLFVSGSSGITRVDKVGGTPEPAGMVGGLDVKAAIRTTNGTAQSGSSQVAYRVVFGKRDANGRLVLGSPSGRGVSKSATITALTGQASHAAGTNIVTVTLTVPHGLTTGEYVKLIQTDATGFFDLNQVAQVTVTNSTTFFYTDSTGGHSGLNTGTLLYQRSTRDVSVSTAIPANLPAGSFIQYYRSLSSVSDLADASDELYLAFEAPVPQPTRVSTLARTLTTVTATTAAPHNLWAGMEVYIQGLSGVPGILAALGDSVGASSPDGIAWTSRTGRGRSVAWNSTRFSAVGQGIWYSPDGVTWTAGSGSTGDLQSVAYGAGRFVAVGVPRPAGNFGVGANGQYATSTDGQTYSVPAGTTRIPNVSEATSVVFQNGRFIAGGWNTADLAFRSAVSSDGLNWTAGLPQTNLFRLQLNMGVESINDANPATVVNGASTINSGGGWTALNTTPRDLGMPGGRGLGPPQTVADPNFASPGYVMLYGAVPWGVSGGHIAHSQASGLTAEGWYNLSWWMKWQSLNGSAQTTLRVRIHDAATLPASGVPLSTQDFTITPSSVGQYSARFYVPAGTFPRGVYFSIENLGTEANWADFTKNVDVGEFSLQKMGYLDDPWHLAANESTIVALSSRSVVLTSTDGVTWAAASPAGSKPLVDSMYEGIGNTWFPYLNPAVKPWYNVVWLPGQRVFLALGKNGAMKSTDGQTWVDIAALHGQVLRFATEQGSTTVVVGDSVCYTSTDLAAWTSRTIPAGSYEALIGNPASSIPSGLYTLTGPASGTLGTSTFTFETTSSGAIGATAAPQDVVPVSAGIVDTLPDASLGASLYTNQTQGGILSAHEPPPMAFDVAVYKDHAFYGGIQSPPVLPVTLLRCGAVGCKIGDLIALPGGNISAQAVENIGQGQFAVFADDPYSTAQSICRVINRSPLAGNVRAIQAVAPGSPTPGAFLLVATKPTVTVSFTVTSGDYTAWSLGADGKAGRSVAPQREKNVVAYSLQGIPDAVPLLNRISIGSPDAEVMRLIPLRESLLVLKEDGVWRITGSSSYDFALEPVDLTAHLVAPETAVVLSNQCWALTTAGVVRISDYGTDVASNPITDQIADLLSANMLAPSKNLCVAVAYESDNTFTLWGPALPTDARPTRGWTFNTVTEKWTGRTDGYRYVLRRKHDDKLWAVQGSTLYRERKNYDRTDCADDVRATVNITSVGLSTSSVVVASATGCFPGDVISQGAAWSTILSIDYTQGLMVLDTAAGLATGSATVLASIACAIEWFPSYGEAGAGVAFQAREVGLVFADAQYTKAKVAFRSDVVSSESVVPLNYADLAIIKETAVPQPRTVRVLVTPEHQRGGRLTVRFEHANAWHPFRLEALSLLYRTVGKMSR